MSTDDIALDEAELLAVVLEASLYGLSLFMFGVTIWTLSGHQAKGRMLTASCSLYFFSTVHLVIDIIRVMHGFIFTPEVHPEERISFFADASHWTFVAKNYMYAAQTLIADGVILYRCYVVWQSKLVMILPTLLWVTVALTGFACPYIELQLAQGGVFETRLSRWITAFWASTLMTNVVATFLLAYHIWKVDQMSSKLRDHRTSELRSILYIIIDAGGIYSLTLLVALICYANKSNGQYVIVDMIMPIISITFYMVIIRVGLASLRDQPANAYPHVHTSSARGHVGEHGSAQMSLTKASKSKVNGVQHPLPHSASPVSNAHTNHRCEIQPKPIEGV